MIKTAKTLNKFPDRVYAYWANGQLSFTCGTPPHGSECAEYLLNDFGIAKVTLEIKDLEV